MIFLNDGAGDKYQLPPQTGVVGLRRGCPIDQPCHKISGHSAAVHPAGNKPLQLLPQNGIIRLENGPALFLPLGAVGAVDDRLQSGRLQPEFAVPPAAAVVPVVQPLQKVRSLQLAVIGDGKPAGSRRIKGCHNSRIMDGQLLPVALQGTAQRQPVIGGLQDRCLGGPQERRGHLRHGHPLGAPAQEGAPADDPPLVAHQPPQGRVRLLRNGITNRCRLALIGKSAPVGKAAGVIRGNDFGVAI